ncbi:MAG: PAS domain S-box protein [Deltaproteobacteria bacterium]|nr:PAS domain S-box protein [Deltaproteobacteria bacterium]
MSDMIPDGEYRQDGIELDPVNSEQTGILPGSPPKIYPATKYTETVLGALALVALYLLSRCSYLLFHSVAEIFSIVVASAMFIIAWNTRRILPGTYYLFLGTAYLFIGSLDLIHTLSYRGMGVFENGTNLPTQLWISARYVESISLLISPLFLKRDLRMNRLFIAYTSITALILLLIFYWDIFPACFVDGSGLTRVKIVSEYIISFILIGAIIHLNARREEFDKDVFRLVIASIIITIGSELSFTLYVDDYGLFVLIGHFLKIISFYLIYKAIVDTGLAKPYNLMVNSLQQAEDELRYSEELHRITLNNISDAVFITDDSGAFTFICPNVENIFDYSYQEAAELGSIWSLLGQNFFNPLELYNSGEIQNIEIEIVDKSSKPHVLLVNVKRVSIKDGTVLYTCHDISDRKEAERALQRAHDQLEARVLARTMELSEINVLLRKEIMERMMTEDALRLSEDNLRSLSAKLIHAQEEERKRIGNELHDELAQTLSTVKLWAESSQMHLERNNTDKAREYLGKITPIIQRSIEEIRRISRNLRPSLLDELGILAAINSMCDEYTATHPEIKIIREMDIQEEEIPESLKIVIFRVFQEALTNVAKHSKADLVRLCLQKTANHITLSLTDNGHGFDTKKVQSQNPSKRGIGLTSMRERVTSSSGRFTVESSSDAGTTLKATWEDHGSGTVPA